MGAQDITIGFGEWEFNFSLQGLLDAWDASCKEREILPSNGCRPGASLGRGGCAAPGAAREHR